MIRAPRAAALALALFGLSCTDAPTATDHRTPEETLVVSVTGIATEDAGIVLRLSDSVEAVEPTRASLEIAWATDDSGGTTIVVVGPLAQSSDLLLVRLRATLDALRADVIEVSGPQGELSRPLSARAMIGRPTK